MDKKNLPLKTKIADPKWIFFVISIPQLILLIILFDAYSIIKTELASYEKLICHVFGFILLIQAVLYSIYALFLIFKNRKVHKILPIIIFLTFIGFLYTFCVFAQDHFFDIPAWIVSIGNLLLFYGTFTIPALFYAILLGERILSSIFKTKRIWINFIFVLFIPTFWFFFFKLLNQSRDIMNHRIFFHGIIFAVIIFTLCFFFFLLRGIISIYKKKYKSLLKLQLLWTIIFTLLLPFLGLLLNECYFPFSFLKSSKFHIENFHFIFGEFKNILFFILAILNGIILCLPSLNNKIYRCCLFIARSILFVFTLYFFTVFIPFMPFFIFSIIFFGLGVFLITPLILLIIHFKILKDDIKYLSNFINRKKIIFISVVSMLIIPFIITTVFYIEKINLFNALNYVYYPDFEKKNNPNISLRLLNKTLKNTVKNKNSNINFSRGIPYIKEFYNKTVLNNLTLSDDKINYLSRIFLNIKKESINNINVTRETPEEVIIKNMNYKTKYNTNTKTYNTWVDLELENTTSWMNEFITYIDLPDGVWINDYYLYVNNFKKKGLLAEKKSVLRAYQMIKNQSRDPGIMYYVNNKIAALKVFPFAQNEIRKTGFKLIHLEPLLISNNENKINLKINSNLAKPIYSENKKIIYISKKVKNNLQKIKRTPYYHFIIDCSKNMENAKNQYIESINRLLNKNLISSNNAIYYTLTGYKTETYLLDDSIEKKLNNCNFKGGFFLDRALKEILFENFLIQDDKFPIIIVLSKDIDSAIYNNDIINLLFTIPDTNYFYRFTDKENLIRYDFNNFNPDKKLLIDQIEYNYVSIYNDHIINASENESSIVFDNNIKKISAFAFNNDLTNNLLTLSCLTKWDFLHTNKTEKNWKEVYYNSITMNTLSFYTSFVVFENEAQEKRMLRKQKNVINSKKFLDTGENMKEEMPEPSLLILCLFLFVILLIKKLIKNKHLQDKV